jgi:hypothetical protein
MRKVLIIVLILLSMVSGSAMAADKQPPTSGAPVSDDIVKPHADKQPPTS